MRQEIYNALFSEPKEVELSKMEVKLSLIKDLDSTVNAYLDVLDTCNKTVEASKRVNSAIKSVENDAKYYNKYAPLVKQDLMVSINNVKQIISKLESQGKDLGIDVKSIKEYKKGQAFLAESKDAIKKLESNRLEFDI